jgi:hypothetical protein
MAITDIVIGAGVKVGPGITVSNNGVITTGLVLGLDAASPVVIPGTELLGMILVVAGIILI